MTDLVWCRDLFPALQIEANGYPVAFFDGPGGTQVPDSVITAMRDYLVHANANRAGGFLTSNRTDDIVSRAREYVGLLLGAGNEYTVSFGANMTSLCFALARAIGRTLLAGDEVLITDLDHEANRDPWLTLTRYGVVVKSIPLDTDCQIDINAFEDMLTDRTRVVAVTYASNAVGTVTNIPRIVDSARRAGALSVIDAVHWVPHGITNIDGINCDFLMFSVYKMFGPHVGVLCGKRESMNKLMTDRVRCQSEHPPESIETGTLNHEGLAGTIAAVEFIARLGGTYNDVMTRDALVLGMKTLRSAEAELGGNLESGLRSMRGVRLYGPEDGGDRVPTYSFTIDGWHPKQVARELSARGIFAWNGHFYAQTLVEKLGLAETGGLVRVGLAPYNTNSEIDRLLSAVSQMANH